MNSLIKFSKLTSSPLPQAFKLDLLKNLPSLSQRGVVGGGGGFGRGGIVGCGDRMLWGVGV